MNWAIGIDMYTLICIKLMTNKNLLYKKINKIKFKKFQNQKNNSPFLVTTLGNTLETTFPSLSCSMVCSCDQLLANEMEVECSITAVPNIFGTRDQFCGRQFFHGWGWGGGRGDGSGGNANDGEWQMKLRLLWTGLRPGGWGPLFSSLNRWRRGPLFF